MVGRGHFGCIGHGFEGSRGGIGDTSAIPRGGGIANTWHAGLRVGEAALVIRMPSQEAGASPTRGMRV